MTTQSTRQRDVEDADCEDCQIADSDVLITEYTKDGTAVHVLLCGPCALARRYAELDRLPPKEPA